MMELNEAQGYKIIAQMAYYHLKSAEKYINQAYLSNKWTEKIKFLLKSRQHDRIAYKLNKLIP